MNPDEADPTSASIDFEVRSRLANIYLPASGGADVTIADADSSYVEPQHRRVASTADIDEIIDNVFDFLLGGSESRWP